MSSEEKNSNSKFQIPNWLVAIAFIIANTVICYLVVKGINVWQIVLFVLIFFIAVIAIIYDTLENIFKKNILSFLEKWLFPLFSIVIGLIFVSSILSLFIPKWSSYVIGIAFDNMPYVSSSLALLAIYLVLKRDLRYRKTVGDREKDMKIYIDELKIITENINNINDKLVKYNPLYSTEQTFKDTIEDLQKLSIKDVALDFSIDSLKQIGKLGFIKIDVSFGEYTKKLFEIVGKSKISVLGSFTFRPEFIHSEILKNPDPENNSDLQYLKLLNDKKYKKIRLAILSKSEIKIILSKALDKMSKSEKAILEEIPEIDWFKKQLSKGFKIFWTTTNLFYNQFIRDEQEEIRQLLSLPYDDEKITDFAIFDGDLLITWREIVEKKADMSRYGTLLISWNRSISKFYEDISKDDSHQSAKNLYTDFMALINKLRTDDNTIDDLIKKIESKKREGYKWEDSYYKIN